MKAVRILLIVSVLALASAAVAPAGAITTYSSCFQVQNLENSVATVSIQYINQSDGAVALTVNDTIAALGKNPYCPIGAASGFNGSVVVSSDKKVAAITNIEADSQKYWGSYTAPSVGAANIALPLIMKGNYGFSTWFNVQNTGSANTDVLVTYSNGSTETFAGLKPGAAHTFNQATGSLPSPFVGSAVVSATTTGGQIAAVVLEVGPYTLHAYEGFSKASKLPIMPLINENNYGYWSSAAIQNTGGTATTVRVNYTPSAAGTACYEQRDIAAGQSKSFAMYAFVYTESPADPTYQSNCAKGATFIGSAVVVSNTANMDLNVIVNQNNLTAAQNKASAYDAFDPGDAKSKVVFPLVMDRNYGYWTSLTVVNAGQQQTSVTCTFLNSTRTSSKTLNPGEALEDVHLNQLSSGYVGAATCVATGGDAKIVGTLNELNTTAGYNWDTFMTFEGISSD